MRVYLCDYVYMYICVSVHIHTQTHTQKYTYTHISNFASMSANTHTANRHSTQSCTNTGTQDAISPCQQQQALKPTGEYPISSHTRQMCPLALNCCLSRTGMKICRCRLAMRSGDATGRDVSNSWVSENVFVLWVLVCLRLSGCLLCVCFSECVFICVRILMASIYAWQCPMSVFCVVVLTCVMVCVHVYLILFVCVIVVACVCTCACK